MYERKPSALGKPSGDRGLSGSPRADYEDALQANVATQALNFP